LRLPAQSGLILRGDLLLDTVLRLSTAACSEPQDRTLLRSGEILLQIVGAFAHSLSIKGIVMKTIGWKLLALILYGIFTSGNILAQTSDSRLLASASEESAETNHYEAMRTAVWGLSVTPDGRHVVTVNRNGELYFWEFETGKFVKKLSPTKSENLFAGRIAVPLVSPDGTRAVAIVPSSDFCHTTLWDLPGAKQVGKIRFGPFWPPDFLGERDSDDFEAHQCPSSAAFSHDSHFLIGALSEDPGVLMRCWNAENGEILKTVEIPGDSIYSAELAAHPLFPILVCGTGSQLKYYNLPELTQKDTGAWFTPFELSGTIRLLAFSGDGKSLAVMTTSADSSEIHIVDENGVGKKMVTETKDWIRAISLSHDGTKLVAGGVSGRISLWDLRSGELIKSWVGHSSHVRGITFAADDSIIVSGSDNGGRDVGVADCFPEVKFWDADKQTLIREFVPRQD